MGPITATLGSLLTDAALQGTLLLVSAFLITTMMRRSSAAARHLVWVAAMAGLLLLPLLSWVVPDAPRVSVPVTIRVSQPLPALPAAPVEQSAVTAAPPARFDVVSVITALWMIGVVLSLAPVAIGWCRLRRLTSKAKAAGWAASDTRVRVMLTSGRSMPMTWGVLRPRILLPAGIESWSLEARRAVLLHELAHVRRRDVLAQLVARLACALHWFNPLAWLAAHRMSIDCEQACDDAVLRSGESAPAYAEQLLRIASTHASRVSGAAAIAMARPSNLERRLLAILDVKRDRRALCGWMVAIAGVLLVVTVPVSMLHARAQESSGQTAAAPAQSVHPAALPAPGNLHDLIDRAVHSISQRSEGDPGIGAAMGSLRDLPDAAAVPEIVTYFGNKEDTIRRAAIGILYEGPFHSIDAAVEPLKQLCHHQEEYTRGMAALALGKHRIVSAEPLVTAMALGDSSGYARRAAAAALGMMGDKAAVAALEKAARDSDEMVASNAKDAIATLTPPANGTEKVWSVVSKAVTTISVSVDGEPKIAAALATLRTLPEAAAVPLVVSYLSDSRNNMRRAAIDILYEGPFQSIELAVSPLEQLCRHEEPFTRGMAAMALGKHRVLRSESLLTNMTVNDASPYARRAAAYALGLLGDSAALPVLEKAVGDADADVAGNAKEAIRMLQSR